MGTYRVAQVCPNGHVATTAADQNPELREAFCSKEILQNLPICLVAVSHRWHPQHL
ncbi:DUF2321 domain-containing protein [Pseudomonas aeruginosa]|nr:DUF2321 domain-containing protein [Pseudomonas aeruginosa]WIK43626.1 DUF2321 domain-containing protein [Pseudomonas aeruginosa]